MSKKKAKKDSFKKPFHKRIKTKKFWFNVIIYLIVLSFVLTGLLTGVAGLGSF